ncbi:MAG: DUF423 domain-containing protein [Variibacter sp.]|nr:DUF423 domain-containing protein [Variibacter sp.]
MGGSVLIALAGLMGMAGVGLAAAAAHVAPGAGLDSAAHMLLFHAAAVVAVAAALDRGLLWRPLGVAGAAGLVVGAALFAGDLALRAWGERRLFPLAAPTGGTVMILAWLSITLAALVRLARRRGT